MKWFHDEAYDYGAGLPGSPREIHGFVLRKPSGIRNALLAGGAAEAFEKPAPLCEGDLARVHSEDLVARLRVPGAVAAAIELPEAGALPMEILWSAAVAPQLHAAGGTCEALRAAASGVWATNLSGGFHHARRDLSHGFCLVNDVALAVERLRREGRMRKTLILDLDLHQGDGNASLFENDGEVFTVSMHEERIFPIPKMRSRIDVGLGAFTADREYLDRLDETLDLVRERFDPAIIVYVAGSDPYAADPLGSLQLSRDGLLERDCKVARFAVATGAALVTLPAGGYSDASPSIAAAGFSAIAEIETRG